MTNKILRYAGIAMTVIGLGSAYYCNNRFNELNRREDITEYHAIKNTLEGSGLQYASSGARESVVKELEARLEELENNSKVNEAEKTRMEYLLGMVFAMGFGVVPITKYMSRK